MPEIIAKARRARNARKPRRERRGTGQEDPMKMITQKEMKRALDRMEPWKLTDMRKMIGGRIVRFTDWKKLAGK